MRSKYEIIAQKELEANGYVVDFKVRPSRFFAGQPTDYFHLFDLIAVKEGEKVRWISIKGHAGVSTRHRSEVGLFPLHKAGNRKEIWYWPRSKKECVKTVVP